MYVSVNIYAHSKISPDHLSAPQLKFVSFTVLLTYPGAVKSSILNVSTQFLYLCINISVNPLWIRHCLEPDPNSQRQVY